MGEIADSQRYIIICEGWTNESMSLIMLSEYKFKRNRCFTKQATLFKLYLKIE